jgi:hypothetical protein
MRLNKAAGGFIYDNIFVHLIACCNRVVDVKARVMPALTSSAQNAQSGGFLPKKPTKRYASGTLLIHPNKNCPLIRRGPWFSLPKTGHSYV